MDFETQASYNLTVTAEDPNGGSSSSYLEVDVNDINEAPIITSPSTGHVVTVQEDDTDGELLDTLTVYDDDGDSVTYNVTVTPNGPFSVDGSGKGLILVNAISRKQCSEGYMLIL